MNYKIAIPSYKRAEGLKNKTLAILQNQGFKKEDIYIFVSDEEEKNLYQKTLPDYYKEIVIAPVNGIGATRNFIQDYFSEGQWILGLDDDIDDVILKTGENSGESIKNLKETVDWLFEKCIKSGCKLWGIYPIADPFFMNSNITYSIKHIVACFYGFENIHDKELYVTLDAKEEFERSILFYRKYGKIMRANHIGVKTRYFKNPGGMQEYRDINLERRAVITLLNKYPDFCKLDSKKSHGKFLEVKLVDKRRKK
jgi:hypothetical protein